MHSYPLSLHPWHPTGPFSATLILGSALQLFHTMSSLLVCLVLNASTERASSKHGAKGLQFYSDSQEMSKHSTRADVVCVILQALK